MISPPAQTVFQSVAFIESNLMTPLSVTQIAQQAANYSAYHFLRLFHLFSGETPGSYLRKRRLSEAARELVETRRPVVDLAFDYQFRSHEAFSRSFKHHFGLSPQAQRREKRFLHLTPPAVLWDPASVFGAISPPSLQRKPALLLAGSAYHGDNSDGKLALTWQDFSQQFPQLPNLLQPPQTYGVWSYPHTFQFTRDFDYLAAAAFGSLAGLPPEISTLRLPSKQYAVFEHHGPIHTIRRTYIYAYGEWLPSSGLEPDGQFDLEAYDERFHGPDHPDSILTILVPIRKRNSSP